MLSRVADNMYWMSRYLERAEHMVRVLDVNMSLMLDRSGTSVEERWARVLSCIGNPGGVQWKDDVPELIHQLAFETDNHASITACIVMARENARQVREELSSEQWQQLNRMYHAVSDGNSPLDFDAMLAEFLPSVLAGVHLFQGVTDSTMTHGEGWQFIQLGRYLERAAATATLLNLFHADGLDLSDEFGGGNHYLEWIGLLRCCTAFEAYCNVYTAEVTEERVLEFLVLNPEFPHSIRYSIDHVYKALQAIEQEGNRRFVKDLTRQAGRLQASLSFVAVSEILQGGIAKYLNEILEQCGQIHSLIYQLYIHYSVQAALGM